MSAAVDARAISSCRSCGAPILWVLTARGNRMPLDAHPNPHGNVEIGQAPGGVRVGIVHHQPPLGLAELYMPHHATCPQGAEWRRA